MKDFWNEQNNPVKKINKKKLAIIIIILILLIISITLSIIYVKNEQFRDWVDKNILRKEISQENLPSIEIKADDNPTVYAFNQNICILNKNEFKIYHHFQ